MAGIEGGVRGWSGVGEDARGDGDFHGPFRPSEDATPMKVVILYRRLAQDGCREVVKVSKRDVVALIDVRGSRIKFLAAIQSLQCIFLRPLGHAMLQYQPYMMAKSSRDMNG
jgi:hypothetical protein